MEWQKTENGSLVALTPFACLYMAPMAGLYYAAIRARHDDLLRSRTDLTTMEKARAWCEQEYAALLRSELSKITTAE